MDFFKSVFSDDPDPSSDPPHNYEEEEVVAEEEQAGKGGGKREEIPGSPNPNLNNSPGGGGGGGGRGGAWSFGGLIKTFASKSESVIQTYRRDLEEFGSGIKKETAAIREVATRAVRDLPVSLETGASVAQESLESVGQAIDDLGGSVWRGTADIISHGKDTLLSVDSDSTSSSTSAGAADPNSPLDASLQNPGGSSSKRYSRFEVLVLGIQSDPSTFSEEPEDAEDFQMWKSGFQLAEKGDEIESLCTENGALESNLEKLVPHIMGYKTFWSRYFYKLHKLKQLEDARSNLVKRAISSEEEEELSWEVDDDDDEEEGNDGEKGEKDGGKEGKDTDTSESKKEIAETSKSVVEEKPVEISQVESVVEAVPTLSDENVSSGGKGDSSECDDPATKSDDKILPEGKAEPGGSCKANDLSVVSSQLSTPEEDDLGWDEIEDLGDNDEKMVGVSGGSPNKVDLCRRLSAGEEDEDLSWDIEDDEPIKP